MSIADVYGSRAERALRDLVEFGGLAAELVRRGKSAYDDDRQLQLAGEAIVSRLGEAAARLPEELVIDHPDIPFRTVKAMRNLIAHAYQRVDPQVVWATLVAAIPNFIAQVGALLGE